MWKKVLMIALAVCVVVGGTLGWFFLRKASVPTRAAQIQRKGNGYINAHDGAPVVWVPAGEFTMGASAKVLKKLKDANPTWDGAYTSDEQPAHKVALDGFWIYQHEVTVDQYKRFCFETAWKMPAKPSWKLKGQLPITRVTWDDACAYARWAGARLPTEAQWEKAARGTDERIYPWGDLWSGNECVCTIGASAFSAPAEVGSHPICTSPYGAQDMAGNVWEWCADWYNEAYYQHAPAKNPAGPDKGEHHVIRGGAYDSGFPVALRTTYRERQTPDATQEITGFRCVVIAPEPEK